MKSNNETIIKHCKKSVTFNKNLKYETSSIKSTVNKYITYRESYITDNF